MSSISRCRRIADLWQALQVCAEAVKAHVKDAAHNAAGDDVGAIQVQEDGANGQHLAAVVLPHLQHLAQESNSIYCCFPGQLLQLALYPSIALLCSSACL